MNKKKATIIFWIILAIVILACIGNIMYAIFAKSSKTTNILTAISGWISGVATLVIGIMAYSQNKKYKEAEELKEKYADVIVESVWIDSIQIPQGQMIRQVLFKDVKKVSGNAFYLRIFNYSDKPIFDIKIKSLKMGSDKFDYDDVQPIYKDAYGRSFLSKDNSIVLLANIPKDALRDNDCVLIIEMKISMMKYIKKKYALNMVRQFCPIVTG